MTNRLAARFGNVTTIRQESPLTDEQLFKVAPSIFAENKHISRSDRYTYIPTIEVLNGLRNEGFYPFMAAQAKTRIEGKQEFTKHMLRLRRIDQINSDVANEIILINSHDGTSSYQMLAGIFRFVCHNGMVAGDVVEDIRIPHRGNITDNVIEAAYTIVDEFDEVQDSIERLKSIKIDTPEAEAFAKAALTLKYDDEKDIPITPKQLLSARRSEDIQNNIWSTLNRVQENLIKGGLRGITKNGNRTKTRPVQSIDNNIKLNKALWTLAEEMAKLKA